MNYSSLYEEDPDMFSNPYGSPLDHDPISTLNNITDESIQIRENLLNTMTNSQVIHIDDSEFVDKEIDDIILKLKEFSKSFDSLQKDLDKSLSIYNESLKETKEDINKINSSINFIKTCNPINPSNPSNPSNPINPSNLSNPSNPSNPSNLSNPSGTDEKVKQIIESLKDYIQEIGENNKLKIAKEDYLQKRKLLNRHIYLINSINCWNVSAICPICITDKIDSYCNPCGHTACRSCLDKNSNIINNVNHNRCPICREQVMDIRKLYLI
jgi:hypothetical protein